MPCAGANRCATKEDDVLSQIETTVGSKTVPGTGMNLHQKQPTSEVLLDAILSSLDDDKAEDIVQIDLRGKSEIADYMVICSGRSSRQVTSIAEKLTDRLKQNFGRIARIEGKSTGDWVLIDTGDVVVHVFRPEVRDFYQLEKMWLGTGQTVATPN